MQGKYSQSIADKFEVITVKTMEGIQDIRPIWEEMQTNEPYPKINADIDRYLSVIEASDDEIQPYILIIKESNQPTAMAIGRIQNIRMTCSIGRRTLFAPLLKELCVVYGGVIGKDTDEICVLVVRELMRVLSAGKADMVSFNHLRTDCLLYRVAKKIPGPFCRAHLSKIEPHWSMSVLENIDAFYQARSKKHRSHLRQYARKLERDYDGQVRVITYSRQEQIEQAIGAAAQISSKTYQRAFGAGIIDDPKTLALFGTAARKGWLQADIIFARDEPVAFQIGLRYHGVYNLCFIGFDPAYIRFNVGTLLFTEVLDRLCGDSRIEAIDFGWSDADYKRSYGNNQWDEACLYIFAPRFFPVLVNLVRSLTLGISFVVQYLVTKLGILNFVQRYRRRHVLRKSSRAQKRAAAVGGQEKQSVQGLCGGLLSKNGCLRYILDLRNGIKFVDKIDDVILNTKLSENETTFRLAGTTDIDSIVKICKDSFPKVVRWQGPRFVSRKWCKIWLDSFSYETWICLCGAVIVGFVVLKLDRHSVSKEIQEHYPNLLARMSALIFCPKVVLTCLVNMTISHMGKYKRKSVNEPCTLELKDFDSTERKNVIWIAPIAVSLQKRRCGSGMKLLRFAEARAATLGYQIIKLSVDKGNEPAIKLYEKNGFMRTSVSKSHIYYSKLLDRAGRQQKQHDCIGYAYMEDNVVKERVE